MNKMKIEAISVRVPSFKVTNEWILEEIERLNPELPPKSIKLYQRQTLNLLKKSGSNTRFWRNKEKGETAFQLTKATMEDALEKSKLRSSDIDLLIHCGVGKGFKEPANAYFYANALGMKCECFDISDACMSWTRALDISYRFFAQNIYKHIMLVCSEYNMYEHGYPYLWKIKSLKQIEYTLPTYTIGEASATTILSQSNNEWSFDFEAAPNLVNLCTIPLDNFEDFYEKDDKINLHGTYKFVSFGGELFDEGKKRLANLVKQKIKNINGPDIYFPHAASSESYLEVGQMIGLKREKNYIDVYPKYGNLVSASIPVAMDMAIKENKLKRGDKVVLWPVSAGMVWCIAQFIY
jgi:3-oxoacyl-[acyl-carrier-protein] synthase III